MVSPLVTLNVVAPVDRVHVEAAPALPSNVPSPRSVFVVAS